MSDASLTHSQLLTLFIALSDGSITDADFARLDAALAEDAKARAFYLEFMRTSAMLEQRGASQEDARADAHGLDLGDDLALLGLDLDASDSGPFKLSDVEQLLAAPQSEPPLVDLTDELRQREMKARQRKNARRRQPPPPTTESREEARVIVIPSVLVWLSAAAVLGLLASIVWVSRQETNTSTTTPPTAQREMAPQGSPAAPTPIRVATVTGALDARLADGRVLPPGTGVYDAPLELAQGIVQLELTSGVTLTLEGPAHLDLGSDMFVALDRGKLVGQVPQRAHGFIVRTPNMDVVDLGTEFGITVDGDRKSEVHVLDGSVRVEPGQYSLHFAPVVADAGNALVVADAAAPTATEAIPQAYYRRVPSAYERLVRDAGPLVYWRFDVSETAGRIEGLGSARATLDAGRAIELRHDTPLTDDPAGRSFWQDDKTPAIQTAQPIDLETSGAFTIEAWVRVPAGTDRRMRILSTNTSADGELVAGGFGLGVSGEPNDGGEDAPVLMFTGYGNFDAFSSTPVPTERWTHVAAAIDEAGTLHMWIDGEETQVRQHDNTQLTGLIKVGVNDAPLRLGDSTTPGAGWKSEHWTGGIDEVALYGRALSPDEIALRAARGVEED